MKHLLVFLFLLSTFIVASQNPNETISSVITFEPNVNPKAKGLKQGLNKTGDSLVLESNKTIREVDIFNNDYFKSIDIDSSYAKIDLKKLPLGNYLIKAKVGRKRIIMAVDKKETRLIASTTTLESNEGSDRVATASKPNENKEHTLEHPEDDLPNDQTLYYWVVYESNAEFGGHKSMSLEYKHEVDDLIEKNKLELQSEIGKNNELRVYEIYNKNKFMTRQLRNHDYYKSKRSKTFNVVPFYDSSNPVEINP